MNHSAHRALLFYLLLVANILALGCNGKRVHVHYIVPVNYSGFLVIQCDAKSGAISSEMNGTYTYQFPASGIIEIDGEGPFFSHPYVDTASFVSGASVQILRVGERVGPGKIAFWDISNDDRKRCWYFLGTDDDYKSFMADYHNSRKQFLKQAGFDP